MNALGNRHIGGNLRILLINNGTGTEFKQYGSVYESFGNDFDKFVAAAGHFGSKSKTLVKHFSQDLGFEYMTASSKEEFNAVYTKFLNSEVGDKSLIFKVFTQSSDETSALSSITNLHSDMSLKATRMVKGFAINLFGEKSMECLKKIVRG